MTAMHDDEEQVEYFSREEALAIARAEARRSLDEQEDSIGYVAYVAASHDYCFCQFVKEDGGWAKTYRHLRSDERLAGEEIRDEAIRDLAMSGRMVSAITLYRAKYDAGLKDAYFSLQAIVSAAFEAMPPKKH